MQFKKYLLLFLSALLFFPFLPAQEILWQKAIGGSGYDNGYKMIPFSDGSYLLGGTTSSTDGIGQGNRGPGNYDVVVTKISAKGDVIWKTVVGGSEEEDFSDMKLTKDGGVIIMGTSKSTDGDIKGNHGRMDLMLARLDRLGKLEWTHVYGGSGNDKGFAVLELETGGYLIGGESGSKNGDMTMSHSGLDAWIAEVDSKGKLIRQKSFGGRGNERARIILPAPKNRFMIIGTTTSIDGNIRKPKGEKDVWVFVISPNFDIVWSRNYGGSDFDDVHGAIINKDGDIVLVGSTFSDNLDLSEAYYHGAGDAWAFCIDKNSLVRWSQCYGANQADGANGIAQTPDGGYVLVGMTQSKALMRVPRDEQRHYDGYIVRTDSMGRKIWQTSFGGADFEYLYEVQPLPSGNYLALGFAESTGGDLTPTQKLSGNDMWFFRFGDPGAQDVAPEFKYYLSGYTLSKKTGGPIKSEITLTNNRSLRKENQTYSKAGNGTYYLPLPGKEQYSVMYTAPGYMFFGQDIAKEELGDLPELYVNVMLDTLSVGAKVILNNIFFDVGKWDLREESIPELNRLVYFMKLNPNIKIEISGHTDNTGNVEQKLELSKRRAEQVRNHMLKAGIPGSNMQVAGYGMQKPIADNSTEEGQAQNRRVEVEVVEIRKE